MTSRALREAKKQLRKQVVPVLDQARRPLLTARVLERIAAGVAPRADIVNEPICRNLLVLNERGVSGEFAAPGACNGAAPPQTQEAADDHR